MSRPKRDLYRLTCNLPTHIVEEVDRFAEKNGLTRTTAVLILLVDGLVSHRDTKEE